jgi:hypothetical protein
MQAHRHQHRERRFHRARPALGIGWDWKGAAEQDLPHIDHATGGQDPEAEQPTLRILAVRGMSACAWITVGLVLGLTWKSLLAWLVGINAWLVSINAWLRTLH